MTRSAPIFGFVGVTPSKISQKI